MQSVILKKTIIIFHLYEIKCVCTLIHMYANAQKHRFLFFKFK